MFRNQYDSDVTVWSPQGRLHQVDYAVEAMKQGSATVGVKSKNFAVLVALKRAANELCSHQKKIYELDTHMGVSISGLLSDGRILARFLQTECSSWRWDYKEPVPLQVVSNRIQLKLQANTQFYGRRPFGVGLVMAGYDHNGTHISYHQNRALSRGGGHARLVDWCPISERSHIPRVTWRSSKMPASMSSSSTLSWRSVTRFPTKTTSRRRTRVSRSSARAKRSRSWKVQPFLDRIEMQPRQGHPEAAREEEPQQPAEAMEE
ncbi:hypothetical protein L596_016799 [Steinernema carpocapsae]|uniref:Proteasome subunit alpha type n=1 Tax=Steinernema carpocapsae TaxID=34508 RepID=A0A4U5NJ20_STECR|nr:hypothetical protein L596_016799 [Steinernema carpocapsae]